MALIPQNPRDQKLLLLALVMLGGAGAYQQLMWKPKNDELNLVATRVASLDSLNKAAKLEIAQGSAVKMREEADVYSRQLMIMRRLVPTENEVPALLDGVSESARRAGLELSDVVPDGIVSGDQFDTYRYKMAVIGPYHRLAEFLTYVGSLQRIIEPINLTLALSGRIGERKPKKDEQFLDARFQIQTYVVHSGPTKPAGAGAK